MPDRNSSTSELETAVEQFYKHFPYPSPADFAYDFTADFMKHCGGTFGKAPTEELADKIAEAVARIYIKEAPPLDFKRETHTDPIAHARYRDKLLDIIKYRDRYDHEDRVRSFKYLLEEVFELLIKTLPPESCLAPNYTPPDSPTIPIHAALADPSAVAEAMAAPFISLADQYALFKHDEMGMRTGAIMVQSTRQRRAPIQETPLEDLFDFQVAAPPEEEEPEPGEPVIDELSWYTHCLFLAQTGRGKTNGVRWRIAQLLPQIAAGKASLIVMEPKGVLCRELLRLADVWKMRDRVVILDPSDTSVSVNLFEKSDGSPQALTETIGRITRIFNTITVPLTPLQQTTLSFALRAILSMEERATIDTLVTILRKGIGDFDIPNLSRVVASFFENDFKPGDGRASEIINRINGLLADPVFEALFGGDRSTFDMLKEMQAGKLIVIDASKANHVYGRFWIEEIARTITSRLTLPFHQRTPTTFVIDEAQNFIADDLHFAHILDTAREARLGMFAALHHMGQITDDQVRHSMYTNMAIKMVANTSADIHNLCRSMGTTDPDFITTLGRFEFAFFGPNMRSAMKVKLPFVDFERAPQMSREEYSALRTMNRRAYAYSPQSSPSPNTAEQLATLSPRAAATEARRTLEDALRGTVMALSLPDSRASMTIFEMVKTLGEHRVIDGGMADVLHRLRLFGNEATHNAEAGDVTKDAALKFRADVDQAVAFLTKLQPAAPKEPRKPQPPKKNDGPSLDDPY